MKKVFLSIITFILGISVFATPFSANAASVSETFGVDTAILNSCSDAETSQGDGAGIRCILNLVIDIMTAGIGVLAVLGITIVGVQYLTAGDNEEKVRKSKRRIFEIIIGLVVYVLIYALLKWVIPS